MITKPILVIGKNAKTGHRVEQRLQKEGYVTRGVSRSSDPVFDWSNPDTWADAMAGTESAYVTFYPDLAVPSAESIIPAFIDQAKSSGLRHLVLLSGRGEYGAQQAENHLKESGLDWNVVRASWFMQNFSEGFMIEGVLGGELKLPAGNIPEPFTDVDDIADVAVAALTKPELRNRLFEVSGPRALTFSECAKEISAATGYEVKFTQIPVEAFIEDLRQTGLPDEMLWLMNELFTVVFDGRNANPTNGVEEALGRPATDFREYVQKAVTSGAWDRTGLIQQA